MIRSIAAAALSVGVAWGGEARAAVFLDPIAYSAAVGSLVVDHGLAVRAVPISVRAVSFRDGFGTFTDPNIPMTIGIWGAPSRPPAEYIVRTRNDFIETKTGPGFFRTRIACHVATYPCFGALSITFAFDQPVLGMGGRLLYHIGEPETLAPLGFFDKAFISTALLGSRVYDGFFGVVRPMSDFTLSWPHEGTDDRGTFVRFDGHMLIAAVPEPGTLALLGGALGLLGLAAAPSALRRRALSSSAGWR